MNYAQIREMDISNGEGIGISLFVQGCYFHCLNCFNPETWNFNDGKEWTVEVENKFIELANKPFIKRISLLGGECLADKNLENVSNLVNKIRISLPTKNIWLYSGYSWEQIMNPVLTDDLNSKRDELINKRKSIVTQCDVFVDGVYIDSLRDPSLKWRGSKNQRVIDVQKSLQQKEVVLYCE